MKVRPVNFNSDNVAGASPEILAALVAANHGAVASYGDEPKMRPPVQRPVRTTASSGW